MIGLDTGFFVELLRGHKEAVALWKSLIEGEQEGLVSSITLFEIERLLLKGAIEKADLVLEAIPAVCRIRWLDDREIFFLGARLSHGLGIPAVDALILAAFVEAETKTIYTTDSHLMNYRKKGIKIKKI